jgi:cardiolipin synthase
MLDFHPLTPLALFGRYSPNDRDHRKILVTDGRLAIVGGINLSTTYQSKRDRDGSGTPPLKWRDTDLEITGPVVRQLQSLFLDQWHKHRGAPLADADFFPTVPPTGDEVVRIIGSTPAHAVPRYYVALLSAIRTAEKSIWISAGYFVPTRQEMEDLTAAARRGVDVQLMLPGKSDSDRALAVGHSHYEDLLEAGVKIYESEDVILHSKMTVVDHVWSVVGSSNFDARSVIFNDEVDAVVLGTATASALEAVFDADRRTARQIDLATWKKRPWSDRLDEFFSRFIEVLL